MPAETRSSPFASSALLVLALCLVSLAGQWNGERLTAPLKEPEPAMSRAARLLREGQAIDLNHATREELELLPRVGPAIAQRIIEARPYTSVEGLLLVRGIGPRTLQRLEGLVRVCVSEECQNPNSVD